MSIFGAVLGRVLADRRGLPADAANRLMVTGYVLGRATSPAISAVVSDRLAEQEASRLPADPSIQPARPPQPAPGSSRPATPSPASKGFLVGNYLGKIYNDSVAQEWTTAGVFVNRVDVNQQIKGVQPKKIGEIVQIKQPIYLQGHLTARQMDDHEVFSSGDTIVVVVNTGQPMRQVPLVEGLKIDEAEKALIEVGFKVEHEAQNVTHFSDALKDAAAGRVIDQEPEADMEHPEGDTVKIFYVPKPKTTAFLSPGVVQPQAAPATDATGDQTSKSRRT